MDVRVERDSLGEKIIPNEQYWGAHTERARENFAISGYTVSMRLIRAYAGVKKACCQANAELGYIDNEKAHAILRACDDVRSGKLDNQFPLDVLQGGAGTSTNMNVNEVIAYRATELLNGTLTVHPIEDVNKHQSTNDTYPTALRIAAINGVRELSERIAELQGAFQKKEKEFAAIVKIGRTELQEAVPITLGAEFSAFAECLSRDRWRTFKCEERLRVVNLGGTAVGTGLCAPRSYIFLVIETLRDLTGFGLSRGENVVDQTANADVFVEVSGMFKAHATSLIKIANDLRHLHFLGEIELPKLQVGSSHMPGKINPVMLEAVIQTGLKVIANDMLIHEAVSRSSFQIPEFMPLIAFSLLETISLLCAVNEKLSCHISGITADAEQCRVRFEKSEVLVTAFVPYVGYERATGIIEKYRKSGMANVKEYLIKELGDDLVKRVLSPQSLLLLGYKDEAQRT